MDQQVTGASTWTTEYQYNHLALNWMKYPSGRIVTYAFDGIVLRNTVKAAERRFTENGGSTR